MRRFLITDRSARASCGKRTRIGMRRSPSFSLATLASMSPTVATRAAAAMVATETPRRAASSAFGRTTISGPLGGVVGPRIDDARQRAHLTLQREACRFETLAGVAGQDELDAGRAELGVVERQPRVGNLAQQRPYAVADRR